MAQWNLFEDLASLRQEIDRAFEGFGAGQVPLGQGAFLPGTGPRRYPLITPGVDPQSFKISVTRNRLTMAGEKTRIAGDVKPEAFHRSERAIGKFVRTFDLPVEVDDAGVQAEYKNGLLVVTIPKAEKAKPKQINVKIA